MWQVERVEEASSTNALAREQARGGTPDGTVIVAARQTGGHGQHGRAWHSPEGGLYLSIVLRDLDDPHLLTLALGNAVADVLEVAGAEPRLKWVNDVLVDGRKIAGILVEGESTGDRFDFLVAGIGVNVNGTTADWPTPLRGQAATLEEILGADSCIPDLESFLLEAAEGWVRKVREGRNDDIVAAWRRRDALQGKDAGFDPDGGDAPTMRGTVRGIDDDGRLLLETERGVEAFAAGRLFA